MSSANEPAADFDERFEEINGKREELDARCWYRSASRLSRELIRLARTQQRLYPYLIAQLGLMFELEYLLDPPEEQEIGVGLVALLESPDRARQFQPDLDEDEYDQAVHHLTAEVYGLLANSTAVRFGYNSEGMHACIGDGIQVCHRTGNLGAINGFRWFAQLVYAASDDHEMALHFARMLRSLPDDADDKANRSLGARDEVRLLLHCGQLEAAEEAGRRALELIEKDDKDLLTRLYTLIDLEMVALLAGKHAPFLEEFGRELQEQLPPQGENTRLDFNGSVRHAVRLGCEGDFAAAVEKLTPWDRWLTEHECLSDWFEVRLHLLVLYRLWGQSARVKELAQPLAERAQKARDWETLHQLARIMDPDQPAAPLPLLAPPTVGPYARAATSATVSGTPPEQETPEAEDQELPETPLGQRYEKLVALLQKAGEEDTAERAALLSTLLAIQPVSVTHPLDCVRLLHLAGQLARDVGTKPLWTWAKGLAGRFGERPDVCNWLAVVGDVLRSRAEMGLDKQISADMLEKLFRKSLDLDPFDAGNFARAGVFYLGEENLGEAERCLARSFRLARDSSFAALRLAEVYERNDRPRDALAVLDMCLREGNDDPEVAWQAAMSAVGLNQYDVLLTYLDRFEAQAPGQPWACYYRAMALLEHNQPQDALAALDQEERRESGRIFALEALRACATSALRQHAQSRVHFDKVLEIPLASIDYLSFTGLTNLAERLWKAAGFLPEEDPQREALMQRLLISGLMPDDFFEEQRQAENSVEGLNLYRCVVRQPLDKHWPKFAGCLDEQQSWREYRTLWGVLARSEEEAAERALAWQKRCYSLPAEIDDITSDEEGYTDRPGVVFQGARWSDASDEPGTERGPPSSINARG
jgi:tetratricopeptide (TPR) repeat protein